MVGRRSMEGEVLTRLGVTDAVRAWADGNPLEDAALGRVVRIDRGRAAVLTQDGEVGADPPVEPLAVGDWVLVRDHLDRTHVEAVAPRRGVLVRAEPGRAARAQLLAANVDLALVLAPLDRRLRPGWVERALVLAHEAGVPPLVVGTKADLAEEADVLAEELRRVAVGVDVLLTSIRSGAGLDELRTVVADAGTVVLLGPSGAGKSSLTNALAGEDVAATGVVRALDQRGRHTTTARSLHVLPGGGLLLDTPGIREIGIWAVEEGLTLAFADVEELAGACRFGDCTHVHEPGCAVLAALEDGTLDPERLRRWRGLREEQAVVAARARKAEAQTRRSAKDRRGRRAAERDAWRRERRRDES